MRGIAAALVLVALLATARADPGPAYLVRELNTDPPAEIDSTPMHFTLLGGIAYFVADDGLLGRELWRSDGTPAGTWMVADVNPGEGGSFPNALTPIGAELWFRAWDAREGCGVWRSDGSAAVVTPPARRRARP